MSTFYILLILTIGRTELSAGGMTYENYGYGNRFGVKCYAAATAINKSNKFAAECIAVAIPKRS